MSAGVDEFKLARTMADDDAMVTLRAAKKQVEEVLLIFDVRADRPIALNGTCPERDRHQHRGHFGHCLPPLAARRPPAAREGGVWVHCSARGRSCGARLHGPVRQPPKGLRAQRHFQKQH